ncbi:MAG: hypothetical protein K2J39_04720 [Ruminococcus sp.]|nr:hypothetical protein [Ruminococcus sp.]
MNKQLEKLYLPFAKADTANNPFCTAEIGEKYKDFFDTYFSTSVMTSQEYDTATTKFFAFATAVEENAFEVGFYTAVQLLIGGGQE